MHLIIGLALSLLISNASKNLTEATLLLQQNQKGKALTLLEKAFSQSNDPEELRDIAGLILEAAPLDHPKRDAYLKYLVRFTADEPSTARWLKELGDRAFSSNQYDEAEDYYLRVGRVADDSQASLKLMAEYKLAWVQWSQGRQRQALISISQLFSKADASLRGQMLREFSQFWWDHGPLPSESLNAIEKLDESDRQALLIAFADRFPTKQEPQEKFERILLQTKTLPFLREVLVLLFHRNATFSTAPCFLLEKVWDPSFPVPTEGLLNCVKSSSRPSQDRLLSIFEKVTDRKDERVDWAEAEILVAMERSDDAFLKVMNSEFFRERSKTYKTFAFGLFKALSDEKLAEILSLTNTAHLEDLLLGFGKDEDYARLQRISPEPWFSIQEKNPKFKNPPLDYFARKSKWVLVEKPEMAATLAEELLSRRGAGDFGAHFKRLGQLKETKLPEVFSESFVAAQEKWLADLDRIWLKSNSLTGDLKAAVLPGVQQRLQENLSAIMAQIEAVQLPEDLQGASESFEAKRKQLLNQLSNRYEEASSKP